MRKTEMQSSLSPLLCGKQITPHSVIGALSELSVFDISALGPFVGGYKELVLFSKNMADATIGTCRYIAAD